MDGETVSIHALYHGRIADCPKCGNPPCAEMSKNGDVAEIHCCGICAEFSVWDVDSSQLVRRVVEAWNEKADHWRVVKVSIEHPDEDAREIIEEMRNVCGDCAAYEVIEWADRLEAALWRLGQ